MNPAANHNSAFREGAQCYRNKLTNRRKNNRGIELFRRHLVGTTGPLRAQLFRRFLSSLVACSREGKDFSALIKRNLCDQTRGIAKTVNAEAMRVARLSIRTITKHSSAQQRRKVNIVVLVG